jgi:hypothetical protein
MHPFKNNQIEITGIYSFTNGVENQKAQECPEFANSGQPLFAF